MPFKKEFDIIRKILDFDILIRENKEETGNETHQKQASYDNCGCVNCTCELLCGHNHYDCSYDGVGGGGAVRQRHLQRWRHLSDFVGE